MAPFNKHSVDTTVLLLYISTCKWRYKDNQFNKTTTREGANDNQNNSNNINNENNITVD